MPTRTHLGGGDHTLPARVALDVAVANGARGLEDVAHAAHGDAAPRAADTVCLVLVVGPMPRIDPFGTVNHTLAVVADQQPGAVPAVGNNLCEGGGRAPVMRNGDDVLRCSVLRREERTSIMTDTESDTTCAIVSRQRKPPTTRKDATSCDSCPSYSFLCE